MLLTVTAFYAGVMALWLLGLGVEVSRRRRQSDVLVGSAGVAELEQAIRAHANACEYVPIALIVMGLAEGMGAPGWLLHVCGLMLVAGRGLHGVYYLTGADRLRLRSVGMMLTVVMIGGLGLSLIVQSVTAFV